MSFLSESVEIIPGDGKEFLPPESSGTPVDFLLIDGNLGVPQKILYKAYLEAVHLFHRYRTKPSTAQNASETENLLDKSLASPTEAQAWSTAVIILLNSGHQSAWNARKRLVESGGLDAKRELAWTTALLTVRECAKHSILWHHRRWLLRRRWPSAAHPSAERRRASDIDDEDALRGCAVPLAALEGEFRACTLAANTYERNYFAWAHRTRCVDALVAALHAAQASGDAPRVDRIWQVLIHEAAEVSVWIERHVADYTAMQYRYRLAALLRPLALHSPDHPSPSAYSHAMSLVDAFPQYESLWYYLRGALWAEPCNEGDSRIDELESLCRRHLPSQTSATASLKELSQSADAKHRHASRFLLWTRRISILKRLNGLEE